MIANMVFQKVKPRTVTTKETGKESLHKANNSKLDEVCDTYKFHLKDYAKVVRQETMDDCGEIEIFPQAASLERALTEDAYREIGELKKKNAILPTYKKIYKVFYEKPIRIFLRLKICTKGLERDQSYHLTKTRMMGYSQKPTGQSVLDRFS